MRSFRYSALIRTFNSEETLPETLRSLERQTCPPSRYVVVDSGSTDATLTLLPPGSTVHGYVGSEFNYSESLNQGIQLVDTEFVLIISSHTAIENEQGLEFALHLLAANENIGAAYFCAEAGLDLTYVLIGSSNFSGYNGMWNTSAVVKTSLLKKRGFRPDVPAAEDQEWSRWLFENERKLIARISGGGMVYSNPRKYPFRKRLNEDLSIALFVRPDLLGWYNIARVMYRAIRLYPWPSGRDRCYNCYLFVRLIFCRVSAPKLKSRYF